MKKTLLLISSILVVGTVSSSCHLNRNLSDSILDTNTNNGQDNNTKNEIVEGKPKIKFVDYNGQNIATISDCVIDTKVGDEAYSSKIPSINEMNSRASARKNDRYTYTFVGWAEGNSSENDPVEDPVTHLIPKDDREGVSQSFVDLNTLVIENNITLHAVYDLTLRTYEVNFYGKDEDEELGSLNVNYGDDVAFAGHDFNSPVTFEVKDNEYSGTTKYTWDNGFQYKDGANWVKGFTKVKEEMDYFATYDNLWIPDATFYFTSDNDFTVQLNKRAATAAEIKIQYSTDNTNWETYTMSTSSPVISQTANNKVYFRGSTNSAIRRKCVLTGTNVKCVGNIEYLLDYETVNAGNHPTIDGSNAFNGLFQDCTSLIQAPELGSISFGSSSNKGVYQEMFKGCTNLLKGPKVLPATTLNQSCYYEMFKGCTKLTKAPKIVANSFVSNTGRWFEFMFDGCTSLKDISDIDVTSIKAFDICHDNDGCYSFGYMFRNCTSLTSAIELPCTTLNEHCYREMFSGCTSLKVNENGTGKKIFTCPEYTFKTVDPINGLDDHPVRDMFINTGGTFTGTPTIGNTYYFE